MEVTLLLKLKIPKNVNIKSLLFEYTEYAYAQGQVDAIRGDIRITQINDSTYTWNKSPWESGEAPIKDTIIIK